FLILILINLQKAATCAWLFAPLKGPVCAKGVHAAPCENSQKWTCHFCEESAGFFVAFGFLILILINLQKAATCAWLFAPLKGPVCAKG
ncbi:hypothetical protein, partial [Intestinimonas butyriciproducens]|uniref:hypothetical protein n=1 Tax=Intestinimonas butyriciproducens TaxID=1297617 RepID=UPI0019575ED2